MVRRMVMIWLAMALGLGAGSAAQGPTSSLQSLEHGGLSRTYALYVPQNLPTEAPVPLVIALHPFASSAYAMQALTQLDAVADAEGFIVVYPNAAGMAWNDGRDFSAIPQVGSQADDIGFLAALADHIAGQYPVDRQKIYLVGFANGAMMGYYAACHTPNVYAAIAVVGALMWQHHLDNCPPETDGATNLLIIHGTHDPNYPFDGRPPEGGNGRRLGADETVNYWAVRFGCAAVSENPNGNVTLVPRCVDDKVIAYYSVRGGSNHWMRADERLRVNPFGIDATEIVTRFFFDEQTPFIPQPNRSVGVPRTFYTYVPPSYDPAIPMPLVVALHGRPGNAGGIALIMDWNRIADRYGFIVVYPEGIRQGWNSARGVRGFEDSGLDDARFLSDLIHDLSLDLNIDQRRIYAAGFSNGGYMAQRLACERPEQYAAIAIVGATFNPYLQQFCDGDTVPIIFIHGTEDVSIPWEGLFQAAGGYRIYNSLSAPDSMVFWVERNDCDDRFQFDQLPQLGQSAGTSVDVYRYDDCAYGHAVHFYVVRGGGHNWPGVRGVIGERIAGVVNMDFHASEVIWQFFARFSRAIPELDDN